jgi:golgi-specific brefeldin A-resistance guanine nucleotide exchange factor 1
MHALVRTVFSRLHALDPVAEEEKLRVIEEDAQEGEIRMTVSTNTIDSADNPQGPVSKTDTPTNPPLPTVASSEPQDAAPASPGPKSECRCPGVHA